MTDIHESNGARMSPYDAWLKGFIVGESVAVRRLRSTIVRVAQSDLPVLVSGPTGAGKDLVAEAIHKVSGRGGSLVAVNICALGEGTFESALFGHVRGAFTSAVRDVAGLVKEAHQGTLFLDEIGALPMREQAKLLRVIETRTYRPVGASRDQLSDFRLVTATNENLDAAVKDARFRDDLRYRLGKIILSVPALCERRDDVPVLVRHFADLSSMDGSIKVENEAMDALAAYDWPGNVRELRSVVSTLVLLGDGTRIRRSEVIAALDHASALGVAAESTAMRTARAALVRLLEECAWDTSLVAAALRVHRGTVYRRMRMLGISAPANVRYRSGASR